MRDPIVKIKQYEEQGYSHFIEELKLRSKDGYIPCGIDKLLNVHGTAIYKAYLSHLDLKKEGIASFFSAQKIEAILFQIIMKKLYESQQPSPEKHSKILRSAKGNIRDINVLINSGEKSDNWLSVSTNIFDCSHGESWAFFLGGGQSMWTQLGFFPIIEKSIHSEYGSKITSGFVAEIKGLYEKFKRKLPSSILELVVIHDKENFKKIICFSQEHARNLRSPTTYDELLSASEQKLQARVLASNSVDPNKIKILRFTPDTAYERLNRFKEEVSILIDKYNLRKIHGPAQKASEQQTSQQSFFQPAKAPLISEVEGVEQCVSLSKP
ncbi:hypothetical protein [Legionella longbeachae]|uniref:Uncharacterized protein n=1 Tax=Legionella longbeachae serogroup 1 (strain NSW150) TaxID=661367 RepID=D3HSI5_LEGLN|nr:hypothetical protein [Legionella longbeachae]VEE02368.1 Uncharacterised protein [Legionella oakridgensis]HBD7398141.1 hypothetical protein [Legionella pneumophila]ARB91349.1 hypothetical protein A6J40_03710 [Legionella longbeachae]ARM32227.1 hypothetical protein B0B39_01170 [Legionella longbeachae]EEZ94991.1 hypothetical protein LLB_0144 [Legionella longbeachae D-4968]